MTRSLLICVIAFPILQVTAQTKKRFSLEVNYGLTGNFFVRSYDEASQPGTQRFYNKHFIGTIGGFEIEYNLSKRSSIGLAYSNSVNKGKIEFDNGTNVSISQFKISHINWFYQLFYEIAVLKKSNNIKLHSGLFYLRMNQQEVDVSPIGASFEERDFKHNKLEEGGVFLGFHYSKKIDTKFDLGIKSRAYYLISTKSFEAITLTPTLTYYF